MWIINFFLFLFMLFELYMYTMWERKRGKELERQTEILYLLVYSPTVGSTPTCGIGLKPGAWNSIRFSHWVARTQYHLLPPKMYISRRVDQKQSTLDLNIECRIWSNNLTTMPNAWPNSEFWKFTTLFVWVLTRTVFSSSK